MPHKIARQAQYNFDHIIDTLYFPSSLYSIPPNQITQPRYFLQSTTRRTADAVAIMKTCLRLLRLHLSSLPLFPRLWTKRTLDFSQTAKKQPRAKEDHGKVEDNIGPEDTVVEPLIRIIYIEAGRLGARIST